MLAQCGCDRIQGWSIDFQQGDADALYSSVRDKLCSLPDDTLVYPAHDYQHRHVSTLTQEWQRNPRLGGGRTFEEFRDILAGLDLPYPTFIDYAVPGNRQCGMCPPDLPDKLGQYYRQMAHSPQG